MSSSFSQTGGAKLGLLNVGWPFSKLTVSPEALHLSYLGGDCHFPKESIRSLRRHKGLLSTALKIEHADPNYADLVLFWASPVFGTSGFLKLRDQMEKMGYEIHN